MALEPTEILPFLYLGNQRNSTDIQALEGMLLVILIQISTIWVSLVSTLVQTRALTMQKNKWNMFSQRYGSILYSTSRKSWKIATLYSPMDSTTRYGCYVTNVYAEVEPLERVL